MADALSIAATSMGYDMARLTSLSNNLANVTTPGFRREIVYSRPFAELLDRTAGAIESPGAMGSPGATGSSGAAGFTSMPSAAALAINLPQARLTFDPLQGTLRSTGAPFDLALQGDGWFELSTPDGPAYTRQGDFELDSRGRLVSHAGLAVAGTGGELTFGGGAVRIDAQGRAFEDGKPAGQLRIVRFERPAALEAVGGGLFSAPGQTGTMIAEPQIRQGYLENSNVGNASEMVRMIETMRHFEAGQKLIQSYDDSLGRAIRTLGEF